MSGLNLPGFVGDAARNAKWLTVSEAAIKGGVLVAGVIVARGMGPGAMGVFTVSYGLALLIIQLFTAGQVEVLIREVARKPQEAGAWLRQSVVWQRKVSIPVAVLALLGIATFAHGELRWTLPGFVVYAWLRSRLITAGAVFKGLERMGVEATARAIEQVVALAGLAMMAWYHLPVWPMGLIFGLAAAAGWAWLSTRLPSVSSVADLEAPGGAAAPPDFRTDGLVFLGLAAALQVLLRGDTLVMVVLGLGTAAIGRYGAALMPVLAAIAVPQLLAVALYPIISRSAGSGGSPKRWLLVCGGIGLGVGVGAATALSSLGALVVRLLYGPQYLLAIPLLIHAAWLLPGACVSMMIGVILAAWRQQQLTLVVLVVVAIMAVSADCLVIPRAGLNGAVNVAIAAHSASALFLALAVGSMKHRAIR